MSLQSETILGYLFAFPKGLGVAMAAGVFISTRGGAGPMFNPLAGTGDSPLFHGSYLASGAFCRSQAMMSSDS